MTARIDSQRADGRGHWPAGKRRNCRAIAAGLVPALRVGIKYMGLRRLARASGVDPRTIKNWITHTDIPTAANVAAAWKALERYFRWGE